MIGLDDIEKVQKQWADEVVRLGQLKNDPLRLRHRAERLIDNLYSYQRGNVLFKPTKAVEKPFRSTRRAAISYFIGGDDAFPEDTGFALQPWTSVEFHNAVIHIDGSTTAAMGHYAFTDDKGITLTVEYSFAYRKAADGQLKIWLHHSSMPFGG